jgi:hypothetical protein
VLVATIWLAAILLIIRDRLLCLRPDHCELPSPEEPPVNPVSLPFWRRILAIPLAILAGLPLILVVAILVAPIVVAELGYVAYHWLRFRLLGIPLPQIGLPEEP